MADADSLPWKTTHFAALPLSFLEYFVMSREPKFGLSFPQILAGALAAASAAVASSWLGVTGTVIGAVVMSVVASTASVLYAHPIERSSDRLRAAMPTRSAGAADAEATAEASAAGDTMVLTEAEHDTQDQDVEDDGWRSRLRWSRLRWKPIAAGAVVILVAGLGLLTVAEVVTGRSGLTGKAGDQPTLVRIVGGGSDDTGPQPAGGVDTQEPAPDTDPSHPPMDTAQPSTGAGEPSESAEPSPGTVTEPTPSQPTPTGPTRTEPSPTQPMQPTPTGPTPTQPSATAPTANATQPGVTGTTG